MTTEETKNYLIAMLSVIETTEKPSKELTAIINSIKKFVK